MSTKVPVLILAMISGVVLSCDSPTGVPNTTPLVVGSVVSIGEANTIYVSPRPSDCGAGYLLRITPVTKFFVRAENGSLRRGSASDMVVGQTARAWPAGDPIDDSCPRGTGAGVIELSR
jgi:hypothetical protein